MNNHPGLPDMGWGRPCKRQSGRKRACAAFFPFTIPASRDQDRYAAIFSHAFTYGPQP
ncbi:hypothetical protein SXCC_03982 [Gluconacetobacter sp. SXCC-1]|nr:hypothetical protein SXCC_03982 [Gluconacetobacter sp. SXCC-1]